ncbi:RagB/SusD family nutrient uptake outer membrane protein [Fulvivirga sp. M361]|uniref:RagB/SusD family nutrient uptake outer membrane protein n=1 Tax=Fulvivirga sp. M361 TaxID=2594266 RepID=UPI00117B8A2B|nr:RagB/SusD family nutrient uptake outer membrane protein [Fulvivirga sp. M361]TRX54785.1 RagB/SusD family nutrient uptake outer membrane protein [Fulvivirga sp. M361]
MKRIVILLMTVALGFGCEDNLEVDNPNEPNVALFWETAENAEQGINAVYSTFHRGSISRWMIMLYSTRTDMGESRSPWFELANALDKFIQPNYNFDPVAGVWSDNYIGINRANQVIDNVPSIDMDQDKKDEILGQAYMLRGVFYYHLVTLFGNVPLMLKASEPQDYPANSLQEEVYRQIIDDLELAVDLLPVTYNNPNDLGRTTKGSAHALMAKVYMQLGEYEKALPSLQWLVEGSGAGIYDLTPDYRDNFLITTENNVESVFEWQFEENPNEFTDNDVATPNHNYGSSLAQFTAPVGIGFSDAEARRWIIYEFDELTTGGNRDPRLEASFLFDSAHVDGPEATMVYGQTFASRFGTGPDSKRVWMRKFLNDHWKNEEGFRSPNNYRYIRYADVLLMYAECLNATNNTAAAYPHVDRVRQRVGLPALSSVRPNLSQADFLEQLKHERLLELAGEGHRWNDLARWGDLGPKLATNDPAFANFEIGKHELLPIPQIDVDANPNLDQNPLW